MASTLLFIQDEHSVIKELLPYLEDQPFKVQHAASVEEALQLIDDHGYQPDAILVQDVIILKMAYVTTKLYQ